MIRRNHGNPWTDNYVNASCVLLYVYCYIISIYRPSEDLYFSVYVLFLIKYEYVGSKIAKFDEDVSGICISTACTVIIVFFK